MKRFTFSVVVTAVLGLAAYSLADAHGARRGIHGAEMGPSGFVQDRGAGFGRLGRRGGGPMFGLAGLRGLDLTDDQQAQIRAILDAERVARQGPPAEALLHRQLRAALYSDTPDAQSIAALQQQLAQAHAERLANQIAVEQKIATVLTAEQRGRVLERLNRPRTPVQ